VLNYMPSSCSSCCAMTRREILLQLGKRGKTFNEGPSVVVYQNYITKSHCELRLSLHLHLHIHRQLEHPYQAFNRIICLTFPSPGLPSQEPHRKY
jgi:hypothetical protein